MAEAGRRLGQAVTLGEAAGAHALRALVVLPLPQRCACGGLARKGRTHCRPCADGVPKLPLPKRKTHAEARPMSAKQRQREHDRELRRKRPPWLKFEIRPIVLPVLSLRAPSAWHVGDEWIQPLTRERRRVVSVRGPTLRVEAPSGEWFIVKADMIPSPRSAAGALTVE